MIRRILPFIKKEFTEILRDRLSITSLLLLPSILLFLYGYAISLDIKEIKISICDKERSEFSREFTDGLISSGYFRITARRESPNEIESDLRTSKSQVGIIFYPSVYKNFLRNNEPSVQILVDGSNAQSSQYTLNYLVGAIERFTQNAIKKELIRINTIQTPTEPLLTERILFNPLLKSPLYLIPGLIAFVIMITGAISTTISIVKEKENRTFEQVILCPVSPFTLIIGKIIPYFVISLVSSAIMILLSILFFDLPTKGSLLFLSYAVIIFLLCASGFGMLISTISSSQQVAFTIAAFSTLLPTIILSGFVFPINNMPEIIQLITYIVPAKYFIAILRGILLKGSSLSELYPETLSLTIFAVLIVSASIIRIKKKGII
ncbi:MAG: ABC transporter permease [Deltaproteobacteria bacterium]|nr:ABC transporter permease [Deltaproteobacteria bacterium]